MPTSLDETEFARLEALAGKADLLPINEDELFCLCIDGLDEHRNSYIVAACNAVPALVAEVRGLREIVDDDIKKRIRMEFDLAGMSETLDEAISENAALREKVEAWEWLVECQETYRKCFLNVTYRHNLLPDLYPDDVRKDAMQEMVDILIEAKEAVHADRE